jgi:hypothetical protein
MSEIRIRPAVDEDAAAIGDLAVIDSSTVPAGRLLVGELDGILAAVVAIETDAAIADPFLPTAGLVALTRDRAAQLRGDTRPGRRRRRTRAAAARRRLSAPGPA